MPSSTEYGEGSDWLDRPPMIGPNGERKFGLGKLVRDGVFASMCELGQETKHEIRTGHALVEAADAKLVEEVAELGKKPNDTALEELADVLTALRKAASARGITYNEVVAAEIVKTAEAGDFSGSVFVEWVVTPAGDEWGDYYAKHPDLFPRLPFGGVA